MPPSRCPGTLQKKVYVPGFRLALTVRVPPWKVGVAPMTGPPVPCWIVKLCGTGELFVNLIATFPAFAESELFVNISWPLLAAPIVRPPAAARLWRAGAGAGASELLAGLEAVVDELLLLLLLLLLDPHAVRPTVRSALLRARAEVMRMW
jgi:hypothetical protein